MKFPESNYQFMTEKKCSCKNFCKGLFIRLAYLIFIGGPFAIAVLIIYERQLYTCVFN